MITRAIFQNNCVAIKNVANITVNKVSEDTFSNVLALKRSAIINNITGVGRWEGDTLICKGRQGIVATFAERQTPYAVRVSSKTKQAPLVRQRIERVVKVTSKVLKHNMSQLNHRPRKLLGFKCLTNDSSKEATLLAVALTN